MNGVLIRKDERQLKRGASRRARQVSGASKPKVPFDWSRVLSPLKKIVVVACVGGLGVAGYQVFDAYQLEHLAIKTVHINGEREYKHQNEVTDIISAYTKNDFFNLEIETMRDRLMQVSWVKAVSLRKEWPDRLVVNIEEHHPMAYWQGGHEKMALLSQQGVRFTSEFDVPKGMPVLSGQVVDIEKIMNQYKRISLALLPKRVHVQKVNLDTRYEWLLTLDNGIQVKYLDDDSSMAIRRLLLALDVLTAEQLTRVDTIDLRYEHGFAIGWGEDADV